MESNQERKKDKFLSINNLLNPTSQLATKTANPNKVEEKDWTTIHPNFAKEWGYRRGKTYQQKWEERGLTYGEAQEWLKTGLEVEGFELATYVRGKGYLPQQTNRTELQKEYDNWEKEEKNAQEYLDLFYPVKVRKNIKEINISTKKLTGHLIIDGSQWPRLEKINVSSSWSSRVNKLTSLTIVNCPNLTEINCWGNQLTTPNFLITDKEKLTNLNIGDNKFTGDLTFLAEFTNLKELNLSKNKFTGSLEPLKNYSRLKKLNLESTKFTSGLEYLPDSLEKVIYSNVSKELHKELAPYGGNLNSWREAQAKDQQIALLQQEQTQFSKQEQEISYLEKRIKELTELIKQQKEKIINIFLRLSPEKKLVQQLIMTYLEFIRFKKQAIGSEDYEEKCDEYIDKTQEIKRQLRSRLSKEIVKDTMNNIQAILTDCEELVRDEIELETKLKEKFRLIEEHYQSSLQITDNPEESNKRKTIIDAEEATQQEQVIQFKRVRSNSLITEMAKLQGERDAYKVLALASHTPIINNTNSSSNNMNDNSAAYHNSQHNEHNQNQFYQGQVEKTTTHTKRNLSISSTTELTREEVKIVKLDEEQLQAQVEITPKEKN